MHLRYFGAYSDLVQITDDRPPIKEEDTGDQFLSVLHLVDGPFLDRFIKLLISPVVTHLSMNHILVDSGQFLSQTSV
jgi:hypothetical protein